MISLELDLHIFQEHYVLRQDRFLLKEYMYANESLEFAAQRRYLFINIYNFQIANFVSFFNSFFFQSSKSECLRHLCSNPTNFFCEF